jgi:hypothetical protein
MGIYSKLLKIQQEVNGLGKNAKSNNYEYVKGSKVLEAIKPIMNKEGIILKQEVISIENTRQDYKTGIGTSYEKSKSEILSKVMMRFTWVDCETGEKDENLFGANGQNDWEKGLGSALTYAERYFLLKYFHINTDEDDIDNEDRKKKDLQPTNLPPATVVPFQKKEKTPLIQNSKEWQASIKAMTEGVDGIVYLIGDVEKKYIIQEKDRVALLEEVANFEFKTIN